MFTCEFLKRKVLYSFKILNRFMNLITEKNVLSLHGRKGEIMSSLASSGNRGILGHRYKFPDIPTQQLTFPLSGHHVTPGRVVPRVNLQGKPSKIVQMMQMMVNKCYCLQPA